MRKKILNGLRGMLIAFRNDQSYRREILWGIPILCVFSIVLWPLSGLEIFMAISAYSFILISELQNTALEIFLDGFHPEKSRAAGRTKDVLAGAVQTAFGVAIIAFVLILLGRFGIIPLTI